MRLVLCAVGQKMPAWADEAYEDFAKRFPPEMRLELKAVKAEPRTTGKSTEQLMAAEAQRLDAACPKGARRVRTPPLASGPVPASDCRKNSAFCLIHDGRRAAE